MSSLIPAVLFLLCLRLIDRWIIVSLILLPGTIAHELCHYLVGLLLNARPTGLTLWPVRVGSRLVLGSVGFANLTWYNAALTGMAPLLLVPVAFKMVSLPEPAGHGIVAVWIEAVLLVSAVPSGTDLRIAFRFTALPVALFCGVLVLLIK